MFGYLRTVIVVADALLPIKGYSDVEPVTDIPPNSIAATAFRAQTTETLRTRSLCFNSLSVERPHQVPQMMTREVMVPVAGLPRVLGRSVREPRGADCGKDCGGAAGADH